MVAKAQALRSDPEPSYYRVGRTARDGDQGKAWQARRQAKEGRTETPPLSTKSAEILLNEPYQITMRSISSSETASAVRS